MKIESFVTNKVMVIRPRENRLDASITADFKSKLAEFVDNGSVNLVINLSGVDLIDSSGLGVLVSVLKVIGTSGEIKLCELMKNVGAVFEVTRLNKIFAIYDSEKEALDSFNS
ncbi:MAG: STAS domain-containing protein [Thermodesulfobacteriota bacterium]|nr:STAS domain-containing protein [Thermodesulfobacteriota bacterium]